MILSNIARRTLRRWGLGGAALLAVGLAFVSTSGGAAGRPAILPEFKHAKPDAWINSAPITNASLRGKVVLVEVYTSG
jgi:hypothetical protein